GEDEAGELSELSAERGDETVAERGDETVTERGDETVTERGDETVTERGDETVTEYDAPDSDSRRMTLPAPPPGGPEEVDARATLPEIQLPEDLRSPAGEVAATESVTVTDL